jgi:hypothetical protein
VAHIWAYKDFGLLEPAQHYLFKILFNLDQSASTALIRLELNIPAISTYLSNNILNFWGRILSLDDSRIPKIVARSFINAENINSLKSYTWVRRLMTSLSTLDPISAQNPFNPQLLSKTEEFKITNLAYDFNASIAKILDRPNGPFISAVYDPLCLNHIWLNTLSYTKRKFWLQLRCNVYNLTIGYSKIKLQTDSCAFCHFNTKMTIYHLIMEYSATYNPRHQCMHDLYYKIRMNLPGPLFDILAFVIDQNELLSLYEFFKALVKTNP